MSRAGYFSIGQMAERFDLSRSTLLYYEKIGLLTASSRSESNYRFYTTKDVSKMNQILLFRSAGIPLEQIKELVNSNREGPQKNRLTAILETRLAQINDDITALRGQQTTLVQLLNNDKARLKSKLMSKQVWVNMLRAAGLDEAGMEEWHRQFELRAPEAHQDFLESLGLNSPQIRDIRARSASK